MALDPYSSCPCGSGKKFKWCCQPIHVAIDRAFQQDAEGQHETALRLMDEIVAEHSGNPEAWGRKAQLLYQNQRLEDAEAALQKAFEINPDYPAGHFLRGLFRYNEGEIPGALLLFRKASDLYDPQAHDSLAEVYSLIANCELRLNRPVAAGAALRKALHYQRANPELQKGFDDLYGSKSRLPESARREYRFLTLPAGADEKRRAAWDRALAGSLTGRVSDAVRAFKTLVVEDANDPAAWYNLAVARAWVGNNSDALEALDRYVALEPDEAKAGAAWALGEVLRCGDGMQDRADYAEYSAVYQVRDPRPLIGAMQEWQKANRLIVVQADEQGTSLTALLLEAPSGLITTGATPQVLRLSAYLMLAGNYLRLACARKDWLAEAQRELQQRLGPALAEPHERVGPPLFSDVVTSALIFPVGVEDEARAQHLLIEHAQKYFEDTWIHQPLHTLNGTAPVDAVGHATLRKKLRGVVQFLQECSAGGAIHTYDFDRLRRKLGLLEAQPIAASSAADAVDIAAMGVTELAGLPVETLADAQLELAYQSAQKLDAQELSVRFAQALVARPPSAEKPDRFPWYTYLVQRALAEGRHDAALDFVNEGEKADCEQNEGKRRNDYEFRRGLVHAKRGEVDQAHDVFQRLIERAPANPRYNGSAAEAMLTLKQPAKALGFAEDGLAKARQQNDRDSEGYLMELVAAAKKQGA
ncbi:MAG TPA: tetratricopeptide repeat protein [Gemmataceae bacterium]